MSEVVGLQVNAEKKRLEEAKLSLKSRWIVAKYLPSRESGEVNIPKVTIHEIKKNNCFSIYTRRYLNKIREETIKKYDLIDRWNR